MRLELDEISAGGIVREFTLPVESFPELKELEKSDQFSFTTPLSYRIRLQKSGRLVELEGDVSFSIKEVCGRCLVPFEEEIESSFALTFTPKKEEVSEQEEVELEAEELGLITYDGEELDLQDPLQEQVVIGLPLSPLCRETCNGLCPECGTNLNESTCHCEKKVFNNKFAALKNLKLDP